MKHLLYLIYLILFFGLNSCSSSEERSPAREQSAPMPIYHKNSPSQGIAKVPEKSENSFNQFSENPFINPEKQKFSTFSLKVDTASYALIRTYLQNNQLPPRDAVRIEELVNYFPWKYRNDPQEISPIYLHAELSESPWNSETALLRVVFQTKQIDPSKIPAMNLVFLLDVSGSMSDRNKLPLLKKSLIKLVNKMRQEDRIAIVVYAGTEGLALPSTSGDNKDKIINAINNLESGGSTNAGAGLELAYKVAEEGLIKNGVNRIILGTDGDFNVGITGDALINKIEEKRQKGIYITLLGLGMGNFKDSTMENISKKGNGNYFYIDTEEEAKKVFEENFASTLLVVAKDTKIQVEFDPKSVTSYRLIGYENRLLEAKDFRDDSKDAGEVGPGHIITAFYELKLKNKSSNYGVIRSRYILPGKTKAEEIAKEIPNQVSPFSRTSPEFKLASAVVLYGLLLRNSENKGQGNWKMLNEILSVNPPDYISDKIKDFKSLVNTAANLKK